MKQRSSAAQPRAKTPGGLIFYDIKNWSFMHTTHRLNWLKALVRLIAVVGLALGLGFRQPAQAATHYADSNLTVVDTRSSGQALSHSADSNLTRVDTRVPGLPVTIAGRVFDSRGGPVAGAKVTVAVFQSVLRETMTDGEGAYRLVDVPAQVATVSASLPGQRTDSRVVPLGPMTARQDFLLTPALPAFRIETVNSPPPVRYVPSPEADEGSRLLVFDGNAFSDNLALLDKTKMLTVLTHGWLSDPQEWALPMAKAMALKGITANVNIVAWDWRGAAGRRLPLPEEKTSTQGIALGQALQATVLGEDYAQPVHFIGHSLGTLVNRFTVDYLRGESTGTQTQPRAAHPWPGFRPHLTLFDEAELGHLVGPVELAGLVSGGNPVVRRLAELYVAKNYGPDAPKWKRPIPKTPDACVWIDNYVSAFGLAHDEAFNVCLQFALGHGPLNLSLGHSYPQQWYQRSVEHPTLSQAGFRHSEEERRRNPVFSGAFPPGSPLVAGALFHQASLTRDELELEPVPWYEETECFFPVFGGAAFGIASRLAVETAIVGKDIIVETVRVSKNAVVTAYDVTTDALTAAYDYVGEKASAGAAAVWNVVTDFSLRLDLSGQAKPGPGPQALFQGQPAEPTAYGIVRLTVPAEADLFSFDYTVSGEAADGVVVFGIGTTNLFSQPQAVVPRDDRQTSPLFPVQTLAGGTNDFYFGLAEATTTNVTVRVQGFRFYTLQTPQLAVESVGSEVVLSWPGTANGYFIETALSVTETNWQTLPQPPTLFAGRFRVTNAVAGEARFFRLRRQ